MRVRLLRRAAPAAGDRLRGAQDPFRRRVAGGDRRALCLRSTPHPGAAVIDEAEQASGASVFGAVLAGGASRRFGSPKALATLDGESLLQRACAAVAAVADDAGVITHLPAVVAASPLPTRPDVVPGAGPMGGLLTALRWAAERGHGHVLCVACDMPFLDAGVLRLLVAGARASGAAVTAPEGPDGRPEPLCAVYAVGCVAEVAVRVDRGDVALHRLLEALPLHRVPAATMAADAPLAFHNVNTRADLGAALAAEHRRRR